MAHAKKKETDYTALNSAFMRIPQMRIDVARALLDIGMKHIFELQGRAPESLLAELASQRNSPVDDLLPYFRMAVYFAENADSPDGKLMHPSSWR